MSTVPEVGASWPEITLAIVVLPAPDSPTSARVLPATRSNEMSLTAKLPALYDTVTSFTCVMRLPPPGASLSVMRSPPAACSPSAACSSMRRRGTASSSIRV